MVSKRHFHEKGPMFSNQRAHPERTGMTATSTGLIVSDWSNRSLSLVRPVWLLVWLSKFQNLLNPRLMLGESLLATVTYFEIYWKDYVKNKRRWFKSNPAITNYKVIVLYSFLRLITHITIFTVKITCEYITEFSVLHHCQFSDYCKDQLSL
jgi:hypothetical protein